MLSYIFNVGSKSLNLFNAGARFLPWANPPNARLAIGPAFRCWRSRWHRGGPHRAECCSFS